MPSSKASGLKAQSLMVLDVQGKPAGETLSLPPSVSIEDVRDFIQNRDLRAQQMLAEKLQGKARQQADKDARALLVTRKVVLTEWARSLHEAAKVQPGKECCFFDWVVIVPLGNHMSLEVAVSGEVNHHDVLVSPVNVLVSFVVGWVSGNNDSSLKMERHAAYHEADFDKALKVTGKVVRSVTALNLEDLPKLVKAMEGS